MSKRGYALNPYLPEYEYIPDGEPHVFGERVYVYGSHDRLKGERFCMNDYVCYSADIHHLGDWRYEGVIYRRTQDPRMADGSYELFAPDVVRGKDGRYYLYYCPNAGSRAIGVAVCDTPAGKYEFYGIVQDEAGGYIGERQGDTISFDPGVFVDDDGRIYLYSGNGITRKELFGKRPKASVVMELSDDMLTVIGEPVKLLPMLGEEEGTGFEGHEFFEASSIRKIGGRYYLVYSSCTMHELCYAVSDRPDGGFRYGGVLISNAEIREASGDGMPLNSYGNNHGGIECIDGEYYVFYHRHTNRTQFSRQGCAERLRILEDGSIPQVEMTSEGLNGKPLPGRGVYPAYCVCNLHNEKPQVLSLLEYMGEKYPYLTQDGSDFDAELAAEPGVVLPRMYITNVKDGMVAVFRYFECRKLRHIRVTVRGAAEGRLVIRSSEKGEAVGEIRINPSEGWTVFEGEVIIADGRQAIIFCYEGEGSMDFLEFELG